MSDNINLDYLRFAGTLVFKSHLIALSVENNIKHHIPGYVIPEDVRQWKYYQNMTGIKHALNNEIIYSLPTTNRQIVLTKSYLDNNPNIRNYIQNTPGELNKLIDSNTSDVSYIMGMVYPVNIDDAIAAKEGKILAYDNNFIRDYEKNVIVDLEMYIGNFLYQYSNPGYIITDDLYGASLYAVLLHGIVMKVRELRYYNSETYAVSDELLNLKLDSSCYIGGLVGDLPRNIRLYLYKNIDYLLHNAGKMSTFFKLADRVLKPLGYICRAVTLEPTNMKLIDSAYYEPNQLKEYETLYLEDIAGNTGSTPIGYQSVFEQELDSISYDKASDYNSTTDTQAPIAELLKHDRGIRELSKQNVIEKIVQDIRVKNVRERIILETALLLLIHTKDSDYIIEYNDGTHVYDGGTILMLLLYLMEEVYGVNAVINKIKFTNIIWFDDNRSTDDLLMGICHDGEIAGVYHDLIEDINNRLSISPNKIKNTETANDFIDQSLIITARMYGHMSMINNAICSSNVTLIFNRYREPFTVSIFGISNGMTPKEYVTEHVTGIGGNPLKNIASIVKSLTDYILNEDDEEKRQLLNITELLKRLSSYTVNYIPETNRKDYLLKRSTIEPFHGKEIISLKDMTYDCKGDIAKPDIGADDAILDMSVSVTSDLDVEVTTDTTIPSLTVTEINGVTILDEVQCYIEYS